MPASVPTYDEFLALVARVAALEKVPAPPTPQPPTFVAQIVDNGDPGYSETGTWQDDQGTRTAYKGNARLAKAGDDIATATWTFNVPPGDSYIVEASWDAYGSEAPNAIFALFDGNAPSAIATATVDQTKTAIGDSYGSVPFQKLAEKVTVKNGKLHVVLTAAGASGQYIVADAVRVSVPQPPAPLPVAVLSVAKTIPAIPIDTSLPDWPVYSAAVAANMAGASNQLQIYKIAHWWAAGGRVDPTAPKWCADQLRLQLTEALAQWNAGQPVTLFTHDSYLDMGSRVHEWVIVLNWFADQLTTQEKADATMIVGRAIFNAWNVGKGGWGSGGPVDNGAYGTDQPGDNYFYSQALATVLWAIHSQDPLWINFIEQKILPDLAAYFGPRSGGSSEGTAYGMSFMNLFKALWFWKTVGGSDFSAKINVAKHLEWLVRIVAPDAKTVAVFGDQARVSLPTVYDYQIAALIWGVMLQPASVEASYARELLSRTGRNCQSHDNHWQCEISTPGPQAKPPHLSYFSPDTGHWCAVGNSGEFVTAVMGPCTQDHERGEQGNFAIYLPFAPTGSLWATCTANIASQSGTNWTPDFHNEVLFTRPDGTPVRSQAIRMPLNPVAGLSDDDDLGQFGADLTLAYQAETFIQKYTRQITFDRAKRTLGISDKFTLAGGGGTWRCTVFAEPTITAAGVKSGGVLISCFAPIKVTPWASIDPSIVLPAWLVEFSGASAYDVTIAW